MKKIIFIFNHFQNEDGVCRAAIEIADGLAEYTEAEVTLCPLFKYDSSLKIKLDNRVIVRPIFKMYFRGFQKIVGLIPKRILYRFIVGGAYDCEIGFCSILPVQIVAAFTDTNNKISRYAWMHGYDEGLPLRREYEKIGNLVCVSQYNRDRAQNELGNSVQVNYAYNPLSEINLLRMSQEKTECVDENIIRFVSVGRISPEKGYDRLLHSAYRLVQEGYKFTLWIIGDGPDRIKLEKKRDELNLMNVKLLGEQVNPHKYTVQADVFVCSSYSEGYSTACTESVMLGVPVISTDVSGATEIIQAANAGCVVDNSEEGIYKGMKAILSDPELLNEWKTNIQLGRKNFSSNERIKHICNVLNIELKTSDNQ